MSLLFLEVVIVNILGVVIVVALRHHGWFIHPSAEVAWFKSCALGGCEAGRGVCVGAKGVLTREELGSHFCVTL